MARSIDRDVMLGFLEEARSYLPSIRDSLDSAHSDADNLEALGEAHRLIHSIKGAASMIGLATLGHIAYYAEEALERIGAGQLALDRKTRSVLGETLDLIAQFLDGLEGGSLRERPLLDRAVRGYRRLYGEPEKGDDEAVLQLIGESDAAEPAPMAGPQAQAPPEPPPAIYDDPTDETEVSPELMEAFLQEADDHLQLVSARLRDLERQPEERNLVQEIRRHVHTLKGAAAMVGLASVSRLAHRMEDLLDRLYAESVELDSEMLELLFETSDTLSDLAGGDIDLPSLQPTMDDLYSRYTALLGVAPFDSVEETGRSPAALGSLGAEAAIDVAAMSAATETSATAPQREQLDRVSGQIVRVPIDRLDQLVRLVSELVVNRSTFEQHFRRYQRELGEMRLSVDRLRRVTNRVETDYEVLGLDAGGRPTRVQPLALAAAAGDVAVAPALDHGFDELELDRYTDFHLLSRELSETTTDLGAVGGELNNTAGDFDAFLTGLGRQISEIQDKLMRLRMVPFAYLASRLHRASRVTAGKQGKKVDLVTEGERTELDKSMLEEMADPLLHLLRNAVDHGIEPPALRSAMGKPERGQIRLAVFHQGTDIVIRIADDGRGFDSDVLRSRAVEAGYISEADAAEMSEQAVNSLAFLPGLSTAGEVSEISGRGVGLDVVKTSVNKVKGTISVESTAGEGVTFTIRLPMTLAIVRVLLVRAGAQSIAVPLASVTQILRLERDDLERLGKDPVVRIEDRAYPATFLGEFLGQPPAVGDGPRRIPVLILNLGDDQIALVVEQILEAREVVVKSLGHLLRRVKGLSGATLMGDGSVVPILDPSDLVETRAGSVSALPAGEMLAGRKETRLDVLIVDDSVSVRRVLSNLIKSAGWNPLTARDGLEALELIQRAPRLPDVILLDIEMPRMDGYELTSTLRAQDSYRELPIVMVTSRAGEKHRQRAFELGATEYLIKPYQDETLLNVVRRLARESEGSDDQ